MLNFHLEPAITLLDSMRMKNQLILQSGNSRKIITKKIPLVQKWIFRRAQ